MNRDYNISQVFGTLYRAASDLELKVPTAPQQLFGPGAVYDFFKALSDVITSAKSALLIIDPYMDDQIFDAYLSKVPHGIPIRLLVGKPAASLKTGVEKYAQQYQTSIEVRRTNSIHDRLLFVDGQVCWVLGQSIKDAASTKPTYLAPLAPDLVVTKLQEYEKLWHQASAI